MTIWPIQTMGHYPWIIFSKKNNFQIFSNFQNLKIALIGYDMLFPQTIAVACRSQNIKLVANQERPINPFQGDQYMLDKYFVFGDESRDFFLENMIDKKMKIIKLLEYS